MSDILAKRREFSEHKLDQLRSKLTTAEGILADRACV